MRFRSFLRVFFALFVSVSTLGGGQVAAEEDFAFSASAIRTCNEHVIITWLSIGVVKVEYSATNTSLNWTTGWREISSGDTDNGFYTDQVGVVFDKILVKATFADSTTTEVSVNTGTCGDSVPPPPPIVAPGSISGIVFDDEGVPLEGVSVFAFSYLSGQDLATTTITDGSFYFSGLHNGEWQITAILQGEFDGYYYAGSQEVVQVNGQNSNQDLVLDRVPVGQLTAIVSDEHGNPIPGAAALCLSCGKLSGPNPEFITDENGRFVTDSRTVGAPWQLGIVAEGCEVFRTSVTVPKQGITDLGTMKLQCDGRYNAAPEPTPGGGGHSGPTPDDGSYLDPVTGNAFKFETADRMCADNSLVTTWTGENIANVDVTAYAPSAGWGTEWMKTDASSGAFSTAIDFDGPYRIDAAVTFTDQSVQVVTTSLVDCTEAEAPDGLQSLSITIVLAGGEDIEGAPWDLYAPVASMQAVGPLASGTVGANNTIAIDGLIAGQYRLVVSPDGMDPIEALITVGGQPVTEATVTVGADGSVTVTYAAQAAPQGTPAAGGGTQTPTGSKSGAGSSAVIGLPSTGTGAAAQTAAPMAPLVTAASLIILIPAGVMIITRRNR